MSSPSPPVVSPDFVTVPVSVAIARSAEVAWARVGDFGGAGEFLDVASKVVAGQGLGAVRRIGDVVLEVMVGSSLNSYAYAQVEGPMAQYAYHGCVGLAALGPDACRLTYTLIYDQSAMSADRKLEQAQHLVTRFGAAAQSMKQAVESTPRA